MASTGRPGCGLSWDGLSREQAHMLCDLRLLRTSCGIVCLGQGSEEAWDQGIWRADVKAELIRMLGWRLPRGPRSWPRLGWGSGRGSSYPEKLGGSVSPGGEPPMGRVSSSCKGSCTLSGLSDALRTRKPGPRDGAGRVFRWRGGLRAASIPFTMLCGLGQVA